MIELLLILVLFAPAPEAPGPIPAYDRSEWGGWQREGCWDRRQEILLAHAEEVVVLDVDGPRCRVSELTLTDPYTRERYEGPAEKIHIDHLVPVAEMHRSGGWRWTRDDKRRAYNLPRNLLPTEAGVNLRKSDRDPGGQHTRTLAGETVVLWGEPWMPPHPAARCTYATRWILVKLELGLEFDRDEVLGLTKQMFACTGETDE